MTQRPAQDITQIQFLPLIPANDSDLGEFSDQECDLGEISDQERDLGEISDQERN